MNRAENPARRWPTRPEPYCAVAPGRPQSIPLTGVSPACLASGYRHVGQPALYSLDDGQSAASHPSIPQNSLLPAAPFVNPHPPRTGGRSDSDSPYPFPRQVMGQRCEPQGSLFPSLCYPRTCHFPLAVALSATGAIATSSAVQASALNSNMTDAVSMKKAVSHLVDIRLTDDTHHPPRLVRSNSAFEKHMNQK